MYIRRIEAGILNAGSDFHARTTPFDVGLGRFVDMDKPGFVGKFALESAPREPRLIGVTCREAEPRIGGLVTIEGAPAGHITAGAFLPYLKTGIGIALMDERGHAAGRAVQIGCINGTDHPGTLTEMPFHDRDAEIPCGKRVDIPERV